MSNQECNQQKAVFLSCHLFIQLPTKHVSTIGSYSVPCCPFWDCQHIICWWVPLVTCRRCWPLFMFSLRSTFLEFSFLNSLKSQFCAILSVEASLCSDWRTIMIINIGEPFLPSSEVTYQRCRFYELSSLGAGLSYSASRNASTFSDLFSLSDKLY